MGTESDVLSDEDRRSWEANGYFILRGFADEAVTAPMLDEVVELCRRAAAGEDVSPALVMPEARIQAEIEAGAVDGVQPEEMVSKVFRLHRYGSFAEFAHRDDVLDAVAGLLGDELDVFLSQFIFKVPGAYGQPWHQDSFYFPFTPDHQVGVWLAVTEATLENGCLWVVPGTHREPVHTHVRDRRPETQHAYVEIVDHDMSGAVPVLMDPGDLLVFDSHVMHRSTDNESDGIRAAMVYHYSPAGTVDRTPEKRSINDWVPARRRNGR